jgi:hypothetical protein
MDPNSDEERIIQSQKAKSEPRIAKPKEVLCFGLAKSVTQGVSMEIQKFGKDAKSAITEEPEKLVIPGTEKMEQAPGIDTLKKELPKIPK